MSRIPSGFAASRTSAKRSVSLLLLISPALLALTPGQAFAQGDHFAYVVNENSSNVSGYKINPVTGALSPAQGSPYSSFGVEGVPTSIAIDQVGGFVYATGGVLSGFEIHPNEGRLSPLFASPFQAGSSPDGIAIDPSGRFAYVANYGSDNVSAYRIEPLTGRLKELPGSPYPAGSFGSFSTSVVVDATGKFVYVTNAGSNNVSGFAINPLNGQLSSIPNSPFQAGTYPQGIASDSQGRYVYVANSGSLNVSEYRIDPTNGSLAPLGSTSATDGGITGITVDPSDKFVYVVGYGGLYVYSVSPANTCSSFSNCVSAGGLTPVTGSPFGTGTNLAYGGWTPTGVAVDYTGQFLYATSGPDGAGNITGFTLSGGIPTQFTGAPTPAGQGAVSIALTRPKTTPSYSANLISPQEAGGTPIISQSAAGINNEGAACGSSILFGEPLEFAFLYSMGVTNTIPGFAHTTIAHGLNDKNAVVGESAPLPPVGNMPYLLEAYLYTGASPAQNLDGRAGGQSAAFAINNAGHVTGSMSTGTCGAFGPVGCPSNTHAFLYTGSGLQDIGTLGGDFSQGRGINNSNEIVGSSNVVAGGSNHVFLYTHGVMHDLGTLDDDSSQGLAINDNGWIVGTARNSSGAQTGFLYKDGRFNRIPALPGGTYSLPAGINDNGDVVGTANVPGFSTAPTHAFIYRDGQIQDLNALVNPSLTLLTSAQGINNHGQILASGLNGQVYILTPAR